MTTSGILDEFYVVRASLRWPNSKRTQHDGLAGTDTFYTEWLAGSDMRGSTYSYSIVVAPHIEHRMCQRGYSR
jgi:hypothetical protein